jgi:DNA-binding protein YbaB
VCEQAAEAAQAVPDETGLGAAEVVNAESALHRLVSSMPGAEVLTRQLRTETVRAEKGKGGVVAEFTLQGELRQLDIRPKYAAEVGSEQLASDICTALNDCEQMISARKVQLASELVGGRALDEILQDNANQLRQRMDELRTRLP